MGRRRRRRRRATARADDDCQDPEKTIDLHHRTRAQIRFTGLFEKQPCSGADSEEPWRFPGTRAANGLSARRRIWHWLRLPRRRIGFFRRRRRRGKWTALSVCRASTILILCCCFCDERGRKRGWRREGSDPNASRVQNENGRDGEKIRNKSVRRRNPGSVCDRWRKYITTVQPNRRKHRVLNFWRLRRICRRRSHVAHYQKRTHWIHERYNYFYFLVFPLNPLEHVALCHV